MGSLCVCLMSAYLPYTWRPCSRVYTHRCHDADDTPTNSAGRSGTPPSSLRQRSTWDTLREREATQENPFTPRTMIILSSSTRFKASLPIITRRPLDIRTHGGGRSVRRVRDHRGRRHRSGGSVRCWHSCTSCCTASRRNPSDSLGTTNKVQQTER